MSEMTSRSTARENRETKGEKMRATRNTVSWLGKVLAAACASLLMVLALTATGARAAKIDNPSPPNFRAEVTGGFLQFIGTNGKPLQLPLDFNALDPPLPNPALIGTIQPNAAGYGVINIPNQTFANCALSTQAGICFPPIPVNVDDIALTIRLLPVGPATGLIDPLSGRVDLNIPIRLKAEGSAMGQDLGGKCYVGSAGSPIALNTTTHVGTFPTVNPTPFQDIYVGDFVSDGGDFTGGWLAGEPYSDESGTWPSDPSLVPGKPVGGANGKPTPDEITHAEDSYIPRSAGSWRGLNETLFAPKAVDCGTGLLAGTITSQLNEQIGLPSRPGDSTASLDFKFQTFSERPGSNAIVNKAVKARVAAPGVSSNPWPSTEVPTAVSAQAITLNASSSYFKTGGHTSERYSFDFGTGTFGPWTTDPVTSFTAPTIPEGASPVRLPIRVRVKDSENDIDIVRRTVRVVPATDISLGSAVSSIAGANFRGGSSANLSLDVNNNSADDASSLPLRLTASLPTGVTITGFDGPAEWSCDNTGSTVDCTLPQGKLGAGATSSFDITVDVAPDTATPAAIEASVHMAGDPNPANNIGNLSVQVVKTDLTVDVTRDEDIVANGWHPYEILVSNIGDGLTAGDTMVNVSLPADFTFRSQGSGGDGWSCSTPANPQSVTCVRAASIAGNSSAPVLTVWARVDRAAPAEDRTVNVSVSTPGDIDSFGGTNSASETGQVQIRTDLAMDTAVAGSFTVGDPGAITYSVINQSVVSATDPTTVLSTLPTGLTVSSVAGTGWNCSDTVIGSSGISCVTDDPINAGDSSAPITAIVHVAQAAYPGVEVSASLANSQDGFSGNNDSSASIEIKRLDVSIEKTAVKSFNVGIEGRYRLNVTNVGDAPTVGPIVVTDELPDGLTLNSASGAGWDCQASEVGQKLVSCELATVLGPGVQAAPIEARVRVHDEAAEAGTVVNTATVDTERDDRQVADDAAVTGNNTSSATTTAVAVDLAIESTHQGAFLVGTDDLYSLTVRNIGFFGTDPGESITVTDELPAGMIALVDEIETTRAGWNCGEQDGTVTCTLDAPDEHTSAMDPESAVTIDIPVHVTDAAADLSENVAEVSTARDADPQLSPNNIAIDPTTVKRIDLELAASVSVPPRAGGIGQVNATLKNIGSAATSQPSIITVPLGTGTSYRASGSTTAGWNCSSPGQGTQITCVRSQSIPAGVNAPVLKLRTNVSALAATSWDTDIEVLTDGEPAQRLENNRVSIHQNLERIDLTISKSHDSAAVRAGTRASHRIKVGNAGNTASVAAVKVEETVDPSFNNVTASGPGWNCTVTGNDVVCTRVASIAPGTNAPEITVGFDIPGDQAGTRNSTARVSSTDDPYITNNSANDPIQIVASADIAVSIDQPGSMRVGEEVSIEYRIRNIGTDSTSGTPGVKLRVGVSDGLRPLTGESRGDWSCEAVEATANDPGFLECELDGELEAGAATTVTGRFEVMPTSESETATLASASTPGEINRSNNFASAFSTLSGVDLQTTVATVDNDYLVAGLTGKRVVTIENVGTSPTTGPIKVMVPLPDGVTWDSSVTGGPGWSNTCNLNAGKVTCTRTEQLAAGGTLPPLTLGLRPSRSNAPSVQITFSVSTVGDENAANNDATRTDIVRYNPDTKILTAPSGVTTSRAATLTFGSNDPGVTFECQVDAGAFEDCVSPWEIDGLSIGEHVVRVRAVNEYGMSDNSPASASWRIEPLALEGSNVPVKLTSTGGTLSLASLGSVDLPDDQVLLEGLLYTDQGGFSIPQGGVKFAPVVQTIDDVLGPGSKVSVVISITATGDGIGTLPNGGGPATFTLPVRADVEAKLGTVSVLPPGTECSLKPITFEFSGTYDEAAGSVRLSQPNVAFPQVTGCATFKQIIDDLLELPRSDIEMDLTFSVAKGVATCPDGQTGTPPDCRDIQRDPAKLKLVSVKAPKKVKSGKSANVTIKVRNAGGTAAAGARICVNVPRALIKGKAKRCKKPVTVAAGATRTVRFRLKTKKGKKGKVVKTRVTAASKGGKTVSRVARIRLK